MKKYFVAFFLILNVSLSAQINLSSSKFIDFKEILDDNEKDVFGYFVLYEKEKISVQEYVLEYYLLDKDMNKLSSGTFKQKFVLVSPQGTSFCIQNIKKIKDEIYVSVFFKGKFSGTYCQEFNSKSAMVGYRKISLNDFSISDQFFLRDYQLNNQPEGYITFNFINAIQSFFIVPGGNIIVDKKFCDSNKQSNQFSFCDLDFKEKWVYKYNNAKNQKSVNFFTYLTSDNKDLIYFKEYLKRAGDEIPIDLSLQVINKENGKDKFEIPLKDADYIYHYDKLFLQDDKIVLIASLFKFDDKREYRLNDKLGYVKAVYDRQTGKQMSKDIFKWSDLSSHFEINEEGDIRSYGRIHFLDFKLTSDNKLIVVSEGYQLGSLASVLDIFTLVFDERMKLVELNKVEKDSRKIHNPYTCGESVASANYFSYSFAQNLGEDEFVFCFKNRESNKDVGKRWVLHVIKYNKGIITNKKIPLKVPFNEDIISNKAKRGYVVLEAHGKDEKVDFSIEKID